jgi:ribosome biogenesis GTPase
VKLKAIVFRSAKRTFECQIFETKEIVAATALRMLLKSEHIVVGDHVELIESKHGFEISAVVPRRNGIYRELIREKKKKYIASNVDLIVIVVSVSLPEYKPGMVDRYITRSFQWDIPAVVVFNKMDEDESKVDFDYEVKKLKSLGVQSFFTSATDSRWDKENAELKALIQNKVSIFIGQSGVGKSKLISKLSEGKFELKSSVLAKVGKGAHTTTWAEMIDCEDFYIIDSPGVRTMAMNDLSDDDLINFFPDINQFFPNCQFTDCGHQENSKGCYFNTLDPAKLENRITLDRLQSFLKLKAEIEMIPDWQRTK